MRASVRLKWAKKPKVGKARQRRKEGKWHVLIREGHTGVDLTSPTRQRASRTVLPNRNIMQAINAICHLLAQAIFLKTKRN